MTCGPLHLRLGSELMDSVHSAASYQLGSSAMYAMLTRGGYIQPLFPSNPGSCLNTAEVGNDVDSTMQVIYLPLAPLISEVHYRLNGGTTCWPMSIADVTLMVMWLRWVSLWMRLRPSAFPQEGTEAVPIDEPAQGRT